MIIMKLKLENDRTTIGKIYRAQDFNGRCFRASFPTVSWLLREEDSRKQAVFTTVDMARGTNRSWRRPLSCFSVTWQPQEWWRKRSMRAMLKSTIKIKRNN